MAPLRFICFSALLGLLAALLPASGAFAQSLAALSCPTLIELRMEMLVRYGFCPRDRFYGKLFREQAQGCNPSLGEFQVQNKVLNDPGVAPQDKQRLIDILRQIQKKNCKL